MLEDKIHKILPIMKQQLQQGKDLQISYQRSRDRLHVREIKVKKICDIE